MLNNFSRLFALDPSLTCSGWVLFDLEADCPIAAGTISPPGPSVALSERLRLLQSEATAVMKSVKLSHGDILIAEGPAPLVKNPASSTKVEQVRTMFETLARCFGAEVPGRINPRTVQAELLGLRGAQLPRPQVKKLARDTAKQMFENEILKASNCSCFSKLSQDIVDALLIAALAAPLIRRAEGAETPLRDVFESGSSNGRAIYGASRKKSKTWTENDLRKVSST